MTEELERMAREEIEALARDRPKDRPPLTPMP